MMKKIIAGWLGIILSIIFVVNAFAIDAPVLTTTTSGLELSLSWTAVPEAMGYTLYYTPNPYIAGNTISNASMGASTSVSFTLWDGASYYVAITANDGISESEYSNIGLFTTSQPSSPLPSTEFLGIYDLSEQGTENYLHLYSTGNFVYEASQWPGDCGNDCVQFSTIRIMGTYTVANNTMSFSIDTAQDSSGNSIQAGETDFCWLFSPYYQTFSWPNISSQNGIEFTAETIMSSTPEKPQSCGNGDPEIIPAGTTFTKINNDPNGYLIK